MMAKLADFGERKLIDRIRRLYRYSWPEDDCFYIPNGKKYLLIKTDSISESSHMPKRAEPEKIGYFFAATNLSDIAAMGGIPRYFMSALTFPRSTQLRYLEGIERGISRCLSNYGARMAGGDLKEGKEINLSGIAIGEVESGRILRRTGMECGDLLCVTGSLGKNAAGYYLWKNNRSAKGAGMLLDVEPRIREGRFISENGASAAMDLSDGVYSAIHQLRRLNGVGFDIQLSNIPIHAAAQKVSKSLGIPIEELALNFGGDYELIFTVPKSRFKGMYAAAKRKGMQISSIGVVTNGKNRLIKNGRPVAVMESGYEHFR